ncbi:uncharacterized protein LOC111304667 isoform X2 [Durio zibethinus]|uniref:Uncharacterized protein LOC111304667 isoform X2 n=1 Tax=Durio zibethinus TaxID=66656 RepID=A0A6P5ZWL9_DURZI|nr:uncharacterized protein LOC111304667 isoform X2 [Durio zibethinus]
MFALMVKGRVVLQRLYIYIYIYNIYIYIFAFKRTQGTERYCQKHDEFMLRELVKRWANHKVMVRWLSRFFHHLDRYFIAHRSIPALNEVGLTCFHNLKNLFLVLLMAYVRLLQQQTLQSIRVDDVVYVINCGKHKENHYNPQRKKEVERGLWLVARNWILIRLYPVPGNLPSQWGLGTYG